MILRIESFMLLVISKFLVLYTKAVLYLKVAAEAEAEAVRHLQGSPTLQVRLPLVNISLLIQPEPRLRWSTLFNPGLQQ